METLSLRAFPKFRVNRINVRFFFKKNVWSIMFRVRSVSQAAQRICHSYPVAQSLLPGHRLVTRRLASTVS